MRATSWVTIGLALSSLAVTGCAFPQVSAEGAKVKTVSHSSCPAVGQFMSFRHDDERALNYESFKKQEDVYAMDQAREKASSMGGDQLVEVYSFPDRPTHSITAFYSVHKCRN